VGDCARANVCAMKADTVARYYNVGTGSRTSLKELAEKLISVTGCTQAIKYQERSEATLVRNRIGCPKRAAEEISYVAEMDLDEGLKKLIEWRDNHKAEVAARRALARY